MNNSDAYRHDLPEDEPTGLLSLPPEMLHEIAVWAPLRALSQVARLNIQQVACIRIQRWYRTIERHDAAKQLRVGDRVLVSSRAARRGMEYATAAAKVDNGSSWKVRMLDDVYFTVPTSQIRRLAEWVDGPWASSVGRSTALASASRARDAAMHSAAMAAQAMRAGIPNSQTALAIAAASAASTAAAAATAASSAAAPSAANASNNAQQAHELLAAAQLVQEAIVDAGIGGAADHVGVGLTPATGAVRDQDASALVARAASAATEAAREASAATSAALAVDSIGSLRVTASTASRAATAAQQVVSAVEALECAPASIAAANAVEVAADALTDVNAAGRALTNSYACNASGNGGASSTAHALDAVQAAAQVLRAAVEPNDVANLRDSSLQVAAPALPKLAVACGVSTRIGVTATEIRTASEEDALPQPHGSRADRVHGARGRIVPHHIALERTSDLFSDDKLDVRVQLSDGELSNAAHSAPLAQFERICASALPYVSTAPVQGVLQEGACTLLAFEHGKLVGGATLGLWMATGCGTLHDDRVEELAFAEGVVSGTHGAADDNFVVSGKAADGAMTTGDDPMIILEIKILAVDGSARRKGYGTLLLNCASRLLEHELLSSSAATSYMFAQAGNDTLPFWRRAGFLSDGGANTCAKALAQVCHGKHEQAFRRHTSSTLVGTSLMRAATCEDLSLPLQQRREAARQRLEMQRAKLARTIPMDGRLCFVTHNVELLDATSQSVAISVRELDREDAGHLSDTDLSGALTICPASLIFACWLVDHRFMSTNRRVCVLNAGCGLAGLAAHVLGGAAEVVLTEEQTGALPNLRQNVAANLAARTADAGDRIIGVRHLTREHPEEVLASGSIDLLIGTDLLCEDDGRHVALSDVVARVLQQGGHFVYVFRVHGGCASSNDNLRASLAHAGVLLEQEFAQPSVRRACAGRGASWWHVLNAAAHMPHCIHVYRKLEGSSTEAPRRLGAAPASA